MGAYKRHNFSSIEEVEENLNNGYYTKTEEVLTDENKGLLARSHYMTDIYDVKVGENIKNADKYTYDKKIKRLGDEEINKYKLDYTEGLISGDFINFGEYEPEVDASNNPVLDDDGNPKKVYKTNEYYDYGIKFDYNSASNGDAYSIFGYNTLQRIINDRNMFFDENRKDVAKLEDGTLVRTLEIGKYYNNSLINAIRDNYTNKNSIDSDGIYYITNADNKSYDVYNGETLLYSIPLETTRNNKVKVYNSSNRAYSDLGRLYTKIVDEAGLKTIFWDSPTNFGERLNHTGAEEQLYRIGSAINKATYEKNRILYGKENTETEYVANPGITIIDDARTIYPGITLEESGLGFRGLAETIKARKNRVLESTEYKDDLREIKDQYKGMLTGYYSNPYAFNLFTMNYTDADRQEEETDQMFTKVPDDENGKKFKSKVIDDLRLAIDDGSYTAVMAQRGTDFGYLIHVDPKYYQGKSTSDSQASHVGYTIFIPDVFDTNFFNSYKNSPKGAAQCDIISAEMYNSPDKEYSITYPTNQTYTRETGRIVSESGNLRIDGRYTVYGDSNSKTYTYIDNATNEQHNLNEIFGENAKNILSQYIEINNTFNSIINKLTSREIYTDEKGNKQRYGYYKAKDDLNEYLSNIDNSTGYNGNEILAIFNNFNTVSYIKNNRFLKENGEPTDIRASDAIKEVYNYYTGVLKSFYTGIK